MVFSKKQNGASGEVPEFGAIFMSNRSSKKLCFRKKLFGLPASFASFVEQIKAGMLLFLFEYEKRELYGVYQASSDGAVNHSSNVFTSSGNRFPAQVQFKVIWLCKPLHESEFRDAIKDNYFAAYKFNFGLSKDQVRSLLWLFSSRKLIDELPPKRILRDDSSRHSFRHDALSRAIEDDRYDVTDTAREITLENSDILMSEYPETSARTVKRVVGNRFPTSFMEETAKRISNNGQATLDNCLDAFPHVVAGSFDDGRLFMGDIEHHGHNCGHQDEMIMPSEYSKDSTLRITNYGSFLANDGTDYVHNSDDGWGTFVPDQCHAGKVQRSLYDGWSIKTAGVNDGQFNADDANILRSKLELADRNAVTNPNHIVPGTYPELCCANGNQYTHPANSVTEVDNSVVHSQAWKSSVAPDQSQRSSVALDQAQISSLPPCSFVSAISSSPCEISYDVANDVGTDCHKPDATILVHDRATWGHDHQNLECQSSRNNLLVDDSILSNKILCPHPKPVMEGYPDADSGLRCNDSSQSFPSNCISHARNSTISAGYPRGRGSETLQVEDYEGMSHRALKPSVKDRNHTGFAVGLPACDMRFFRGSSHSQSICPVAQLDKSNHVIPKSKGAGDADILLSSEVDCMHWGVLSESHREEHSKVYLSNQHYRSHERAEPYSQKKGSVFSRLTSASDPNNDDAGRSHVKNRIDIMVDEVMEVLGEHYKQAKRERKFSSFRSQYENVSRVEKHQHSQTRTDAGQPTIPVERNLDDNSADECTSQLNKGVQVINFKRRSEVQKNREETKADVSRGSYLDVSRDKQLKRRKLVRPDFGDCKLLKENDNDGERLTELPSAF
ncbi:hypothetical protein Ancab_019271 [Ancistrocladus abbreviatus]